MKFLKFLPALILVAVLFVESTWSTPTDNSGREGQQAELHFNFDTENGQHRSEDIKYEIKTPESELDNETTKPVEYRGGYSFISADGYEYTVLYKANKNGFQPYVTAHKIKSPE